MAIDGNRIIRAVMEGSRIRDAKGIIPLFGVYLSIFSVDFYNRLSFDFERMLPPSINGHAESLLIEAAQECGYATFHGIRTSREWEELVTPMVENPEDQILGFTAVAVAFGWGDLSVLEINPGERLRIRADQSYEASGFLQRYGMADSPKCYMLRGVAAAFMDLLYGEEYPEGCFTFSAREPRCRAKGDEYCEFVVEKPRRKKIL